MTEVEIAGIFPPRLPQRFEVNQDFLAARLQQRPDQPLRLLRWSYAGQSPYPGATQNPHENGFGLVIERVRRSDLVCFSMLNQCSKPLMAQLPCSCFKADPVCGRTRWSVARTRVKFKLEPRGHLCYELLVRICLRASNVMMEMGNREHNAERLSKLDQDMEKRYGIGPARARDSYALSGLEQAPLADVSKDFFH
jgi:hypothetical protein